MIPTRDRREIFDRVIRLQLLFKLLTAVVDDTVPDRVGQVQSATMIGQLVHHPETVDLVAKPLHAAQAGQDLLAQMAEGCVPQVVPHADRPRQVRIQVQRATDRRGDRRHVHDVLDAVCRCDRSGGQKTPVSCALMRRKG